MAITVEAVFENGVFVPVGRPALADHERVRLTVEPVAPAAGREPAGPPPRRARIKLDARLAGEIASSAEFHPDSH